MTFQSDFTAALRGKNHLPQQIAHEPSTAQARFAIYRNNLIVGLRDALRTGFPVLRKILGADNFDLIARAYIDAHLPDTPVMAEYGADMPGFIATFPGIEDMPYLADIARIEQGLSRAYHAADHHAMDANDIMAPDYDGQLTLAPSVQIITSKFPIFDIWQFATGQSDQPATAQAQDVMIIRPEFDPVVHPLPMGGVAFLNALIKTGSITDAVVQSTDLSETCFQNLFAVLLVNGAITMRALVPPKEI